MPSFKVRLFTDGKLASVQTLLAGSAESAAEQLCGKGLIREGKHGDLAAIVNAEKGGEDLLFFRRNLGSAGVKPGG